MFTVAILAIVAGYGIYQATKPVAFVSKNADQPSKQVGTNVGTTRQAESIHAQDARETGFIGKVQTGNRSNSVYAQDITVLDPGAVDITNLTQYKTVVSQDNDGWVNSLSKTIFAHDYNKPIPTGRQYRGPLPGVPHPGAEVRSGQNADGRLKLLGANPFVFPENATKDSTIKNNTGYSLSNTFGNANSTNYDRYSETRMSWMGLVNPWNESGAQRNLNSYVPLDKDQLRGKVPLNDPRKIFDVGARPAPIVSPPTSNPNKTQGVVFNRRVNVNRKRN